ncbi:hypothetical protein [Streptomyces globisporus]|uniref:hypothetical protein n=1 Tax=Streptomyces globisporus TaxID=1908 RepID=UPI0004CAA245|nr:hypothetical protein [Streptomyces globisporus]
MSRTTRAPASAALLGLVLSFLICGAFAPDGTAPGFFGTASGSAPVVGSSPAFFGTAPVVATVPGSPPAFATAPGSPPAFRTAPGSAPAFRTAPGSAPVVAAVPVVLGAAVPGCDPGRAVDEGAASPVVPPRAHGFAELLPALAADRATPAVRRPDAVGPAAQPGREPPARVPTPVELSVLRV